MRSWLLLFPDAAASLDAGTWAGDEAEAELDRHEVALPSLNRSTTQRHVVILGQFNTGSNLLKKLFQQNFHYSTDQYVHGTRVWKHLRPAELSKVITTRDLVLLVVLRDPLSWLQSMRKAPYDLRDCVRGATLANDTRRKDGFWIDQPCALKSKRFATYTMPSVDLGGGLADYWNLWTREYDDLPSFGFDRVVLIRYEDLVLRTDDVLAEIGGAISLQPPASAVHVNGPAKPHGRATGRAEAVMKLNSKSYLRAYSPAELAEACGALDRALMREHGYTDCD